MSDDKRRASTGSQVDDKSEVEHEALIEGSGEIVIVPGEIRRQRITLDGVSYAHVSEDGERWVYRAV